jgi:two-component system nitrate/nitrite response regulator NarP
VEVLRQIRGAGDKRSVVILTAALDDFSLREAMGLNVDGIVMKDNDPALLLDCLNAVRAGKRWIDPDIEARAAEIGKDSPYASLSPRERKLVALVARGLRNREIASELGVTEGTVKVYLHSIFEKLGVASRVELAIRVSEEGEPF